MSVAIIALALAPGARADAPPPPVTASMQCDRVGSPGRVKCAVEARASSGSMSWADVVIVDLPPFAAALKGRIGPADSTGRDDSSQRWAFGLVARQTGDGEIVARVRAVVCERPVTDAAAPACTPVEVLVKASVHVG